MIVPFPRKERSDADVPSPEGRDADVYAMGVMLSYLEAEAARLDLPRLADILGTALKELYRS